MHASTRFVLALGVMLLAACTRPPEPPKGEPRGRAETQGIRNAEVLGYSGADIAKKVDGALDANDARKQNLDAELQAQQNPR